MVHRQDEDGWRMLFEHNPLPMWVFDIKTLRFLAVNEAAVAHYGWSAAEFSAMTLPDIRSPEDVPALMADLAHGHRALHGGVVWRHRRKNGEPLWVEVTAHSVHFEGREGRLVLAHDVSERLRAERALRDSEARWERLFAASALGIASATRDGRFLSANPAFCTLVGRTAAEVLGRPVLGFTHADDVEGCDHALAQLAANECDSLRIEKRYVRPDGRTVWARAAITMTDAGPGAAQGERLFVAVVQDIDAQRAAEDALRRSEAQLHQAQRLEAVGQLTGGIAHDFNNLLTVILGSAELLAERLAGQPALQSLAQMTRTAAERGAELTQRLLAFARKQPLQPQPVDAHQLLAGMDALLRRTLPEDIELELVRGAGLWLALADPAQLESALLNLVLNARDAMPSGGRLTLETANTAIDQAYADQHADVLPGQYVLLSVSDTGTGMAQAQLARAFEPFYTTKPVGKGSGLGLSMVYGYARQSRGHVKLYSEVGHGTTVRLYLPRALVAAGASSAPAAAAHGDAELRGTALVLVVEDDDLVRRHAADALAALGYSVLLAAHGAAAMALLQERADIDLLFTDVVMPGGMNGRQLAEAALVLRPGLKVLYTSGYTENAIVHHGRLDPGVQLLPKPYRQIDLARKLRVVLGGAA